MEPAKKKAKMAPSSSPPTPKSNKDVKKAKENASVKEEEGGTVKSAKVTVQEEGNSFLTLISKFETELISALSFLSAPLIPYTDIYFKIHLLYQRR